MDRPDEETRPRTLRVAALGAVLGTLLWTLLLACSGPPFDAAVVTVTYPFDGGIPYPGPGNEVDETFTSVEPNDTPEEATPLGVATLSDLVVWVGANAIGGSGNQANYFVFQSAPGAGQLEFNMCYAGGVTAMTASLWKVADGKQEKPPVATWKVTDTCTMGFSAPLEASTLYLLGMEATGGPGSYTA